MKTIVKRLLPIAALLTVAAVGFAQDRAHAVA